MRIIGGKYKGRVLRVAKGLPVRPTTDRTKEALFNMLMNRVEWEDIRVLDLFAGTGNISLECISRGAAEVISVDKHRKCVSSIEKSRRELGITQGKVICMDVKKYLKQCKESFGLIFLDPPYAMEGQEELIQSILDGEILEDDGLLILEHSNTKNFSSLPGFESVRKYGSSHLSFFQKNR